MLNFPFWLNHRRNQPAQSKSRRRSGFFRPRLELLESRLAPAAFTVNTLNDTLAANLVTGQDSSGNVSLRSALAADETARTRPAATTTFVTSSTGPRREAGDSSGSADCSRSRAGRPIPVS